MPNIKEYEDEFRDFCLLVTNQLLLGIFMTELPIISYEIQVGTEECNKRNTPLILSYEWIGGINNEKADTRRLFNLKANVSEAEDDFKLTFTLFYSGMGQLTWAFSNKFSKEKEFLFRPIDKTGEAIVNETLKWIRQQMVAIMSGSN